MFYRDRLIDEYETHQRSHSYLKDELDFLVADTKVKRQSWYKGLLVHVGDASILGRNSMRERHDNPTSTTLVPLTRQRNETIFE